MSIMKLRYNGKITKFTHLAEYFVNNKEIFMESKHRNGEHEKPYSYLGK